jgi:2'-5' RNA ligase
VKKYLYLIAVIPPDEIAGAVKAIKQEMADSYNSSHTLKSPAHITLQKPFSRTEEAESSIMKLLESIAAQFSPFPVHLNGFGHFDNRVIFIHVDENNLLHEVYEKLQHSLKTDLGFTERDSTDRFTPHVSVPHRDLKPAMFKEAWLQFKERKIEFSFTIDGIYLLKHNDRFWEVYKKFEFKND